LQEVVAEVVEIQVCRKITMVEMVVLVAVALVAQ
jgi:hypothetical protein